MTPEEIWKEAVHGSQKAWNQLYALFGGKMYQFFFKNTGNPQLAMDKTQEVFERLFRHKEAFQGGTLSTWMFRIAKNMLIDEWRKRPKAEILTENPPETPDSQVSVEDGVVRKLEHEAAVKLIDEALPLLGDEERMIIGLTYLGGLSFPELAQVLELPLGTVKTKVRQARLKLDRLIGEKSAEKVVVESV